LGFSHCLKKSALLLLLAADFRLMQIWANITPIPTCFAGKLIAFFSFDMTKRILIMKDCYINTSITFIIAMMGFVISPATVAETQLDMLDTSANNFLFSDQDIISVHHRRFRRHNRRYHHHHRRYNRYHRRYDNYRRYNHQNYRKDRHHRRHYYDDRYDIY
jgi:hypothetical protein